MSEASAGSLTSKMAEVDWFTKIASVGMVPLLLLLEFAALAPERREAEPVVAGRILGGLQESERANEIAVVGAEQLSEPVMDRGRRRPQRGDHLIGSRGEV